MKTNERRIGLCALCLSLYVCMAACGDGALVFPGEVPTAGVQTATPSGGTPPPATPTATATPVGSGACGVSGTACAMDVECCSGHCVSADGVTFACR